ncbi:MAG: polysaccharide ABC transporter ATP-binding protein [Methylocystis sp.]|nr:polysaccharide ABC transporter ATP-binding protein [Methylocystis sp.]
MSERVSSDIVLSAEHVGKSYRLRRDAPYGYGSLRDVVAEGFSGIFDGSRLRRSKKVEEDFWALRDVSFTVKRGEVVGVIGRNGAGKSTLLKILSRITEPTTGRVTLDGRVASLLEVGTGFHPELTGRENIFLNGAILGMSRAEIKRKFDQIVDFAEIDRFIDTPVKRYSSGMYVRLAFAIAAHLDPEILIVDEVLAVGDVEFQKKCLGAMRNVSTESGRTILFVSHNMRAIQDLCHSAMLIEAGAVAYRGAVKDAVTRYLDSCERAEEWRAGAADERRPFQHLRACVVGAGGGEPQYDEDILFVFDYCVRGELPPNRIAFNIRNEDGVIVMTSMETDAGASGARRFPLGKFRATARAPARILAPGKYFLTISEPGADGESAILENILSFVLFERGSPTLRDNRPGIIAPTFSWTTERLE